MDAIRALGLQIPAGRLPQIFLRESEREQAAQSLPQKGLKRPRLALGLGASRLPTKSWALERFAGLAAA